jgi:hypothetical protein
VSEYGQSLGVSLHSFIRSLLKSITRRVKFLNVVYYKFISYGSFNRTRHLRTGLCTALKYTQTNHPTAALKRWALTRTLCCLKCALLCSACFPLSLRAKAWLIPLIWQNCTSSLNLANSHTFNSLRNNPSHAVCSALQHGANDMLCDGQTRLNQGHSGSWRYYYSSIVPRFVGGDDTLLIWSNCQV